jgi:hypothetical protein
VDMCAFPNPFEHAERFPRNTRKARGQCGQSRVSRTEKSAATASIAGAAGPGLLQKTHVLLSFSRWHGVC